MDRVLHCQDLKALSVNRKVTSDGTQPGDILRTKGLLPVQALHPLLNDS